MGPLSFTSREGVLHMCDDDSSTCLFVRTDAEYTFDALWQLHAAALDTRRTVDGSVALCLQRVSLMQVFAKLCSEGRSIRVHPNAASIVPGDASMTAATVRYTFGGCWDPATRLTHVPTRSLVAFVASPLWDETPVQGFHVCIERRTGDSLPRLTPTSLPWSTVSVLPCIRLSPTSDGKVRLYHGDLQLREDRVSLETERGFAVHIVDWDPFDLTLSDVAGEVREIAHLLLSSYRIHGTARSSILCGLLGQLSKWKSFIREHVVVDDVQYVEFLRSFPKEVVAMLPAQQILNIAVRDERVSTLVMMVSRRLFPSIGQQSGVMHHDMVNNLGVDAVAVLPIDKACLARLVEMDFFADMDITVCPTALLTTFCFRTVVVPCDVDATDMTVALAMLLKCGVMSCERIEDWRLQSGGCVMQTFKECDLTETFRCFRLNETDGIFSFEASGTDVVAMTECMSIDDLDLDCVGHDPQRRNHKRLKEVFPDLFARLTDSCDALLEVRGRKTRQQWTLEDIDNGGDLSSLGMSILLAIVLEWWHGAKVRVFISMFHTAVVGFWNDGDYVIVDPCSSRLNCVTLKLGDAPCQSWFVKKGTILEVKSLSQWHVGYVERVDMRRIPAAASMTVLLLKNNKRRYLPLSTRNWRPLARSDNTDAEDVVRSLVKRAGKSSDTVRNEATMEERDEGVTGLSRGGGSNTKWEFAHVASKRAREE